MGLFDPTPSRPPCVMVSSTFYDLRQIRDDLRQFIEGLGYRPLLSEHPSFPIDPDTTTIENCRRRVEQDADILVLVIGGRYGCRQYERVAPTFPLQASPLSASDRECRIDVASKRAGPMRRSNANSRRTTPPYI